nr:unnamed protein product [Callosobruchus analis]
MAMFHQLLNKVKYSLKSGAGRDDIFKPSWFAYETMANFLQPVYSARDTINTEQDLGQIAVSPPPSPAPSLQPPARKGKRSRPMQMPAEAIEGHLMQAVNVMQKVTNKPERDDCSLYGELLATRLRALDEFNREPLMHTIDNLVFETTMNIKRGIIPSSTISQQLSNSAFRPTSGGKAQHYYQQPPIGLSHPQHSKSIFIPSENYTSQVSPASSNNSLRTTTPQPSEYQQTAVGLSHSQQSPAISIPPQNYMPPMSPASSNNTLRITTPQSSPNIPIHSENFPLQPSTSTSIRSQNEDDTVQSLEEDIQYTFH